MDNEETIYLLYTFWSQDNSRVVLGVFDNEPDAMAILREYCPSRREDPDEYLNLYCLDLYHPNAITPFAQKRFVWMTTTTYNLVQQGK